MLTKLSCPTCGTPLALVSGCPDPGSLPDVFLAHDVDALQRSTPVIGEGEDCPRCGASLFAEWDGRF